MAHETHNGVSADRAKSTVSFKSSFWLVVILVGLFIAALNFIKVMGGSHEGKEGEKTETFENKAEGAKESEGTPAAAESHATEATTADTGRNVNTTEKAPEAPSAEHK